MQPTNLNIDQSWLTERGADAVMQALMAKGGVARFVGGCVRDALFHRPVRDIDIATDNTPDQVIELLGDAGLKHAPTGLAHGTVTAIAAGQGFEVTTLRQDIETDGRHAEVVFTDDWLVDAQRRDFTMNALYCDADGTIYDPVGGIDDLAANRIRFIGRAEDRIREDYLRILRFFRFHAWYGGNNQLDDEGLQACADNVDGLSGLSIERIREEFLRLLAAEDPIATVQAMDQAGILTALLPVSSDIKGLQKVVAFETELDLVEPLRRLAGLLGADRSALGRLASGWKMSNADKKRLRALAQDQSVSDLSERDAKVALYHEGQQAFVDRLITWSDQFETPEKLLLVLAQTWKRPVFPLIGDDVLVRGVSEGQAIGQYLQDLESQWIAEGFTPDRDDLLSRLDAMIVTR